MAARLVLPRSQRVIAGVCAALANRFGTSRALVRVGVVLFDLFGVGEIAHIVLWILVLKEP